LILPGGVKEVFMAKVRSLFLWVLIFVVSLAFIAAGAEQTKERRYNLPDHGVLQMKVPASWKEDVQEPTDNRLPPRIVLGPASGNLFHIVLFPFWKVSEDAPELTDKTARQMVQRAVDKAQPNATEKTLKIMELQGATGKGYYFAATDKAPEPGSYKFLTQGILPVGELAVAFTILTNDDKKETENAALTMLKAAIQVKGK
jgi:hypothetical protein